MARYKFQGTARDGNGRIIPECSVTVYESGGSTLATCYSVESGGTAISGSSVTADSMGSFYFWVDDGDYSDADQFKIMLSKTGFNSQSWDDIRLITASTDQYVKVNSDGSAGFLTDKMSAGDGMSKTIAGDVITMAVDLVESSPGLEISGEKLQVDSTVMRTDQNLSDLESAGTARTNLGLEFAGQSTAETGTDNADIMTALRTYQQVTARIVNQSTAETGTNNTGMMTPLRVAQAITALAATGINVEFQKQTTNVNTATDYTYSSLSFTPKLVLCIAYQAISPSSCSIGISANDTSAEFCLYSSGDAATPTTSLVQGTNVLAYSENNSNLGQQLTVKTWGTDSLTVTADDMSGGGASTDFYLYIIG